MIELCGEKLSVWCIWPCVLNMSHTCFRVIALKAKLPLMIASNRYSLLQIRHEKNVCVSPWPWDCHNQTLH